jgi:hypothetical protein
MERDSRRVFEQELRSLGRDLNALMARVRAARRDLKEDGFYADAEGTRRLMREALVQLAEAATSLDEARRALP